MAAISFSMAPSGPTDPVSTSPTRAATRTCSWAIRARYVRLPTVRAPCAYGALRDGRPGASASPGLSSRHVAEEELTSAVVRSVRAGARTASARRCRGIRPAGSPAALCSSVARQDRSRLLPALRGQPTRRAVTQSSRGSAAASRLCCSDSSPGAERNYGPGSWVDRSPSPHLLNRRAGSVRPALRHQCRPRTAPRRPDRRSRNGVRPRHLRRLDRPAGRGGCPRLPSAGPGRGLRLGTDPSAGPGHRGRPPQPRTDHPAGTAMELRGP